MPNIRDIIEAACPCNFCQPELRRTCESLGYCDTRDAWRVLERSLSDLGPGHSALVESARAVVVREETRYRKEHGYE